MERKVYPATAGGTVGRSGSIEPRADGSHRVILWWPAERMPDGGQRQVMARRTVVATWRGADRVVQAWLKAGR